MTSIQRLAHAYETNYFPKKRYVEYLLNEIKENKIHTIYIYAPFTVAEDDTWWKEIDDALIENTSIVNYNVEEGPYRYDQHTRSWGFLNHIVERNRKIQDLIQETKIMKQKEEKKTED